MSKITLWKYQGSILSEFPHPQIDHLTLSDFVTFNRAPVIMLDQWFMFYACDPRDACSLRFIQGKYRLTTGITRVTGASLRRRPPWLGLTTVSDRNDLAGTQHGNIRYGKLVDQRVFDVHDIMSSTVWKRTNQSQGEIREWSTQGCDNGHAFDGVMNHFCQQHLGDRNWVIHLRDINKKLKLNVNSTRDPEQIIASSIPHGMDTVRKLFRKLWKQPVIPAQQGLYHKEDLVQG